VPLSELAEQAATLDRGQLPVVPGQHQLGPAPPRFHQQLAADPAVQHRRLVDHHQRAPAPLRAPVLEPEQLGVHRPGLFEPVRLQVLSHGIGRRQPQHRVARRLVRRADRPQRVALAGPGPALDDPQPADTAHVLERRPLVRA
jgi:hypothetical protein